MSLDETDPQDPQKPFDPAKADAAAKAILAQGGSQHDVDTYLSQTYGLKPAQPSNDIHAQYRSGALQRKLARDTANDTAQTDDGSHPFLRSLAATGANIAQGIPGMEAVEAGAAALTGGQDYGKDFGTRYRRALTDIGGETEKIPGALRTGEKIAGGITTAPLLPANPMIGGAILGGADRALQANPDISLARRGVETAVGAGVGAVTGKLADKAITSIRGLTASNPTKALLQMQADRAASAKDLFTTALQTGNEREATQAVQAFIQDPEIAPRIAALQQLDQFKNTAPESPEMMDALYKSLSDEARQIKKGLSAVDPSKPNTGRFREQNVSALKDRLLSAVEQPGTREIPERVLAPEQTFTTDISTAQSPPPTIRQAVGDFWDRISEAARRKNLGDETIAQQSAREGLERHGAENIASPALRGAPEPQSVTIPAKVEPAYDVLTQPMMPTYRAAVQDFAKRSAAIDAFKKGYGALRSGMSGNLPAPNALTEKTPEALADWANGPNASPEERAAALQGILSGVRKGFGVSDWKGNVGRQAATAAGPMLRSIPTGKQDFAELLQNLALASLNSRVANP